MGIKPTYEDSHIVVAAVRVLSHKAAKPPTPEDVADLLGLAPDFVRNLIVALGKEGILRVIENPFEIRAQVADYLKLEELPREAEGPSIQTELDDFMKRKKQAEEDTERMLNLEEIEKRDKDKMSKLEEEMKKMKGKRRPPAV